MKRAVLWVLALGLMAASARADVAAQKAFVEGVQEVVAPGIPGGLAVYGDAAFVVLTGKNGKAQVPVIAAAQAGAGRVVAFGHDGYFAPENLEKFDTPRLMGNALRWAGNGKAKIGVFRRDETLNWLKGKGLEARLADVAQPDGVDVLVVNAHDVTAAHVAPLRGFVERGGGLLIAATGWGWAQINSDKEIARDFPANKLLASFGMVWTEAMLDRTGKNGFVATAPLTLAHAGRAFEAIRAHLDNSKPLPAADTAQAAAVVGALASSLPPDDNTLLPRLKQLATNSVGEVVPFARRPVKAEDGAARLLLTLQNNIAKTLPVDQIKAHPAGTIFPGDVPPNAKPVTKTVAINMAVPEWHSTGLYAAPGAKLKISLPPGADKIGLGIRIGCHTDTLWHLDTWERAPDISRAWPLNATETTVANPFGGLVYVTVPNGKSGNMDVTIAGAHEAPLFVLGQTDLAEWKTKIRWQPGPWAEIATDRVIVTVPSRSVRDIEDPREVAQLYVDALDATADLATIPRRRTRPERIVADQQISAGYMHSGYPVMTWLDVEKSSVDPAALRKNSWGHWHEFGHNHQVGDWTFDGTGEVTNNLFTLYVWEKVIGKPRSEGHPALRAGQFEKMWANYVAGGKKFEKLKGDPFLFLNMYIQLQEAFGWDTFKKVFAEYRQLKPNERPKSDNDKRDQWMVRFSRAAGRNLGPFFQAWNVPTSEKARDSIKNLPAWMPPGFNG